MFGVLSKGDAGTVSLDVEDIDERCDATSTSITGSSLSFPAINPLG